MMPTFDFWNTVRLVGRLAKRAYGTSLGRMVIFFTALTSIISALAPSEWVASFFPQIPSVSSLINIDNINQDIFNLCGYACAADWALRALNSFFEVINWLVRTVVASMITLVIVVAHQIIFWTGLADIGQILGTNQS